MKKANNFQIASGCCLVFAYFFLANFCLPLPIKVLLIYKSVYVFKVLKNDVSEMSTLFFI